MLFVGQLEVKQIQANLILRSLEFGFGNIGGPRHFLSGVSEPEEFPLEIAQITRLHGQALINTAQCLGNENRQTNAEESVVPAQHQLRRQKRTPKKMVIP